MTVTHPIRLLVLLTAVLGVVRPMAAGPEPDDMAKTRARTSAKTQAKGYAPTDHYETRTIEGWTVLIHRDLPARQPELADRTLTLLKCLLFDAARRLPAPAVEKLRTVRIWVEEEQEHCPGLVYHPDPGWLRDHGVNPDKARCVEVANARNFWSWSLEQPCMVLHELAHAYHHQFLPGGFDNPVLKAEYDRAVQEKLYQSVLHINGRSRKAYAVSNPMEYFAESSEAYFGTNDFFPFVRSELKKHDPKMFAAVKKLWALGE